jgi:high-affinity nickel-transport protein
MLLGLFLGMRHATDPDHVIAVTTIVSRYRTPLGAAAIGAAWGVGHTFTILVIGSGIILFGWVIPPRIGLATELSVGVMLVALGVMSVRTALQSVSPRTGLGVGGSGSASTAPAAGEYDLKRSAQTPETPANPQTPTPNPVVAVHIHAHAHGDYIHVHAHQHDPEQHPHAEDATPVGWLDRHLGRLRGYRLIRPLLIGVVHGLAGSAAAALLILATIRTPRWAVAYLALFGFGTVLGMMVMTTVIVLPFAYSERQFARFNTGLRLASGVISVAFGLFVAYEMGIVHGLFTAHPQWTPE